MNHWGINALNHGSSLAVLSDGVFDKIDSDNDQLSQSDIVDMIDKYGIPDRIFWYERPWLKKARQLYAGQYSSAFDISSLPSRHLKQLGLNHVPVTYTPHHSSHAAAGYYTSPFNHCTVVVLDAIGEFECASIWEGSHGELKKVWSRNYPNSLGLFYSAFTKLIGLEPIKQEHLLQQMSEQGDPMRYLTEVQSYVDYTVQLTRNLHRGVLDWPHPINNLQDRCDIAAAVQRVFEYQVSAVMLKARQLINTDSLVYMGGCAMNSKANEYEAKEKWKYVWSLPNPGDPSSSIGAVLYHTKQRLWRDWGPVKHIKISI
jgi:carbamoyltransferase